MQIYLEILNITYIQYHSKRSCIQLIHLVESIHVVESIHELTLQNSMSFLEKLKNLFINNQRF